MRPVTWLDPGGVALAAAALVAVVSHAALIWHHAVPDFDTDTFIHRANGGCDPHWIRKGMGDTAHPLGNALIPQSECIFHGSGVLTPAQFWYLALTVALVLIVAALCFVARGTEPGRTRAALAVAYLGMSPAMRTMSVRADEKWIGVALFLAVVLAMLWFHRSLGVSWRRSVVVAVSALCLGLWHTQYLIILGVALALWGLLALISPSRAATTRLKAAVLAACVLIPPGAAVFVLTWTGYVTEVPYHKEFFSIFNKNSWHGPVPWVHDFITYSARWLPGWLGDDGMREMLFPAPHGIGFVLLGTVSLLVFLAVAASTRNFLLGAIALGALALPFMYEPDNAERWDAVSIVLALCLAVGSTRADRRLGAARSRPTSEGAADEEVREREPIASAPSA